MAILAITILLAGCHEPEPGPEPEAEDELPDLSGACKTQRLEQGSGNDLVVCEELHEESPFLRLPEAETGRAFATIKEAQVFGVDGTSYGSAGEGWDDESKLYSLMIYDLELSGTTVSNHRPVLRLQESFFIEPFLGKVAEGTISPRIGDEEYDLDTSLPIRIQINTEPTADPERGRDSMFSASIANFDQALTASNGECLPALTSHGDEATFPEGGTVEIEGYRVPSMHVFGDDEFVIGYQVDGESFGSMMSRTWYRGPLDIVQGTLGPSGVYSGQGHGTPGSIPNLDIEIVEGGGDPCTPT